MDAKKSFYDLDYLVEFSEKRVEQYTSAYQLILARLANIILIYTLLGIYLLPIIQDLQQISTLFFKIGVAVFLGLITVSIIYTIKLMMPVYVAYLEISQHYYQTLLVEYENKIIKPEMTPDQATEAKKVVNSYLMTSYIDELNRAQQNNRNVFVKKSEFYYRALLYGLLAVIPYLLCVGYHINKKDDKVEKVEIVNQKSIVSCDK